MDLHRTTSATPVYDAEYPATVAVEPPSAGKLRYPHPVAAIRMAERQREDAALDALEAAHAQLEERGGDAENAGAGGSARSKPGDVSAETPRMRPALPPCWDAAPENVSSETPRRSVSQRRADVLEHILERFLAGKCSGSAPSAHELVVHIAHDALCDVPESSGASFDHDGAVAVETARRLGCDGACRFPGCDRSRYVHAHHIRHWADGGETSLDNLVTLCSQHHRQVHEGGYGVRVNEGAIQFMRPDGRVIPPAGLPHGGCFRGNTCAESRCAESGNTSAADGAEQLAAFNAARGLKINADTARCGWTGERMDYNIAIDGLCLQAGYS